MTNLKTKIKNLKVPKREGNKVTATWTVPAKAKKSGAGDSVRFDGLDMNWVYDAEPANAGVKKGKGDVVSHDTTGREATKSDSERFDRKKFHPYAKAKLKQIEFWVRGYNDQGSGSGRERVYGPWAHRALKLAVPDKPTTTFAYDPSSGMVTAGYEAARPDGAKECCRTQCWVTVGGSKAVDGSAYESAGRSIGSWEVPSALNLAIGGFVKCTFRAVNQGLRGDSGPADRTLYVVHPHPGALGEPSLVYETPGVAETAMVRVPVTSTGRVKVGTDSKGSPVWQYPTTLTLQRVKDVPTDNDPTSASQMSGWEDVMSDNGVTNGLSDTWQQGVSGVGLHTWYRLKAERDGYTVLSMPVCASVMDVLESSTVAGAARIDSVSAGADGKSLRVALSGKEADDEGYEVSWSAEADAWESTDQPDTFLTTGSSLVIKKLDEGTRYYIKARAYDLDADGNYIYGRYSGTADGTPYTTPSTVALLGSAATARGGALQLSWTYDTDAQQEEWRLVDAGGSVFKSGAGPSCACTVMPEEYGDAESLSLHVELTTGGGWAQSEQRTFYFADAPTCAADVPAVVTAQPVSLSVESDSGDTVSVSVTAHGCTGSGIGGDRGQMPGDIVWSGSFSPEWEDGAARATAVELPFMELHNGASYTVRVSARDGETGLASAAAEGEFSVNWSHTASQPAVTVEADAQMRSAAVTVDAPADYEAGDRFDLYRTTPDGERLIASSVPFGSTVNDRLAPYSSTGGGLAYTAVTRTADGDTCASDDAPYSIACRSLRFDWDGRFVELPYNFSATDSFEKDSEVRQHVDGSKAAHWNSAVGRRAELSTDVVRFRDVEQQRLVRDMLQHAGSVFVRTPDGLAFSADVSSGTVERAHDSKVVGMSFSASEHDLGDGGRPSESDIDAPQWGGGAVEVHRSVVYDSAGGFPMDSWSYVGTASGALYVYDGEAVRSGSGAEMEGWTWDGLNLYDGNGDAVDLDAEA